MTTQQEENGPQPPSPSYPAALRAKLVTESQDLDNFVEIDISVTVAPDGSRACTVGPQPDEDDQA